MNCGSPVECRQLGGAPGLEKPSVRLRRVGERGCRKRLAIAEQRILLAGEGGEFRAGDPGALNEFELPRDIRIEADEVEPGLRIRCVAGSIATLRSIFVAIFPAAPQDAMEAGRCHRVVLGSGERPHGCIARPRQRGRGRRAVAANGQSKHDQEDCRAAPAGRRARRRCADWRGEYGRRADSSTRPDRCRTGSR